MPLQRVVAHQKLTSVQGDSQDAMIEPGQLNVFHIPQAVGSPFVPAQAEFVLPYGVQSVLGMGGVLPEGELFVVILFSRVTIGGEVAERLRELALTIRDLFVPFPSNRTFEPIG